MLDTAIGAALSLAAYALWPSWERSNLSDATAALIARDRAYLHSVFDSWLGHGDDDGVRSSRSRTRVARTNAEASVQRALFESARSRTGFGTAEATGILASLRPLR